MRDDGRRPLSPVDTATRCGATRGDGPPPVTGGFDYQLGGAYPDELLVHRRDGSLLVDSGWPDEHLIDLSTSAKRAAAADRQQATIDLCAQKGYRAVEFDNLDSYLRSRGAFTVDDAAAFAGLLTDRAHHAGLATAQKNATDVVARGRDGMGSCVSVKRPSVRTVGASGRC